MSEYQFYEFQAIDQPLSPADREHVKSLSSRVKLTASNAQFLYHYSSFRSEPEVLLDRCFDLFVYVANFGIRQLMIRFPKASIDPKIFEPYCVEDGIEIKTTKKSIILDINISREDYYGWLEEEAYAADLSALRQEILQGDLRLLYLAWLAAGFAEDSAEEPGDLIEPPVPANLHKLSSAQKSFADLFQIDSDLISAAAIASPQPAQKQSEPIADWIAALSEADRNAYLLRVAQGDAHVGTELMKQLRKQFGKSNQTPVQSPGRSLETLINIADEQKTIYANKAQQKAATARQNHLQKLASKVDSTWEKIHRLIDLKQAKPYDEAVDLLVDLRDLAQAQ